MARKLTGFKIDVPSNWPRGLPQRWHPTFRIPYFNIRRYYSLGITGRSGHKSKQKGPTKRRKKWRRG